MMFKKIGDNYCDPVTNEPVYQLEVTPGGKKAKQIWLNKELYDKKLKEHQAEMMKKKKKTKVS